MKDGDLFLLADPDGRMASGEAHGLGLYYHDCRYRRTYEIRLSCALPVGLGSGSTAGHCAVFQLTSPDVRASGGTAIAREQLGIAWERALDGGELALTDTIRLANWGREPTLEVMIEESPAYLRRVPDEATGLMLLAP
jgi:hypothetical protein